MVKKRRNKKYTIEELRIIMAAEKYILLSEEYVNTHSKLEIQCPEGHIYSTTRNCWRNGRRCPVCYKLNNHGSGAAAYKGGVVARNIPLYNTYYHKISYCEKTRRCPEETILLQVKCRRCKKWFTPTRYQVENRIWALERAPITFGAENNFYCSTKCKQECPTYKKSKRIANRPRIWNTIYTNQELRIWSLEVRRRANNRCEVCGKDAAEAHHILSKKTHPFFALDPDNGIAICRYCHHHVIHIGQCAPLKIAANPCTN